MYLSCNGTIYIENSSNLVKIWAEMKKPMLEFLHWNSYVGICMQALDSQEINAASYCIVQLIVLDFSGPGPPLLYCGLHNSLS